MGTLTMGNIHDTMEHVRVLYADLAGTRNEARALVTDMRSMRDETRLAFKDVGREAANVRAAYDELGKAIKSEMQRRGLWQTFIDRFGTASFAVMLWALVQYVLARFL